MKVLVIPEDQTYNGYILKPLVKEIVGDAGRPSVKVTTPGQPRIRGYPHAMTVIREQLPVLYGFYDLWFFFPDADCATDDAMRRLECDLAKRGIRLICCPAQPEVEIYACAAFRQAIRGTWEEARTNPRMKEEVFQPLLESYGDPRRASGGRDIMIGESLRNLPLLYRLCPELKELRDRITTFLMDR